MVQYRRNFIPGGTFFFTVTLENRTSSLPVEHIGLLRAAFRAARAKKPFTLDAIAVLPDHLHTVMTLPPGDSDFPDRWRQIKSLFTRAVAASGVPLSANHRGEYPLWQRRFWERTIRNERDLERCVDYCTTIRPNTGSSRRLPTGNIRLFTDTSGMGRCHRIGVAAVRWTIATSASGRTDPDFASLHPGYRIEPFDFVARMERSEIRVRAHGHVFHRAQNASTSLDWNSPRRSQMVSGGQFHQAICDSSAAILRLNRSLIGRAGTPPTMV
ncbi:REP element-mobilizing transposase RayT [Bradyrhizobium sp. USDA 4454]